MINFVSNLVGIGTKPEIRFYSVKIIFADGREEAFEAVGHSYPVNQLFEIRTTSDEYIAIPYYSIRKIIFGKDFSKLLEMKKDEIK